MVLVVHVGDVCCASLRVAAYEVAGVGPQNEGGGIAMLQGLRGACGYTIAYDQRLRLGIKHEQSRIDISEIIGV